MVGELFASDVACRVDRGPALVDHHHRDGCGKLERADKGLGFPPGRPVSNGDRLDLVFLDQAPNDVRRLAHLHGRLAGVDDVVVEQLSLSIQADHLAPRSKSRVDGEDVASAERRCQEQLAEVVGKHLDGGAVSPLLRLHPDFRLDPKTEQPFVAILHGEPDLFPGWAPRGADEEGNQPGQGLLLGRGDPDQEEALGFTAADGQHPVARDPLERLAPVEVVLELGPLLLLSGEDLGPDSGLRFVELAELGPGLRIVADPFGQDVPGSREGGVDVPDFLLRVDECLGQGHRVGPRLVIDEGVGQRFQPSLLGDGRPGASLRPVGGVQILQGREGFSIGNRLLEEVGQEVPFLERFEDGAAALFGFSQLQHSVADPGDRHLVQRPGRFLAVSGDERDGGPFCEKTAGGEHLAGLNLELRGDLGDKDFVHVKVRAACLAENRVGGKPIPWHRVGGGVIVRGWGGRLQSASPRPCVTAFPRRRARVDCSPNRRPCQPALPWVLPLEGPVGRFGAVCPDPPSPGFIAPGTPPLRKAVVSGGGGWLTSRPCLKSLSL